MRKTVYSLVLAFFAFSLFSAQAQKKSGWKSLERSEGVAY